jgi:SAM-dependent methyltransferase
MSSKDSSSKNKRYRQPDVVAAYDERRFSSLPGRLRNRRKMTVVNKALALIDRPGLILDLPCGTGRFFQFLGDRRIPFLGADDSEEMLRFAASKVNGSPCAGLVAADAAHLPFRDQAFDVVLCIRFLFHVSPQQRIEMMREMARVSRRYLILDYRLWFSLKNMSLRLGGLLGYKRRFYRPTRKEMLAEIAAAGLEPLAVFRVAPVFSDKHIVLCRKKSQQS